MLESKAVCRKDRVLSRLVCLSAPVGNPLKYHLNNSIKKESINETSQTTLSDCQKETWSIPLPGPILCPNESVVSSWTGCSGQF